MRQAVYSGSRNLYGDMVTAAKSLVANSDVERVWLLIEDARFPYDVPDIVRTMDVSGQRFFPASCANISTGYTYMSLMRVTYSKLFPDADRILQLDVDTVVVDDVSALWDIDLGKAWFAACSEHLGTWKPYGPRYYNIGVAMFNLDQIRKDGADNQVIHFLNTVKVPFIDQDAWCFYGDNRAIDLDTRYNECFCVGYTDEPAIVHFAGHKGWQDSPATPRREYLKRYRDMSWDEVMERHAEKTRGERG